MCYVSNAYTCTCTVRMILGSAVIQIYNLFKILNSIYKRNYSFSTTSIVIDYIVVNFLHDELNAAQPTIGLSSLREN